MLLDTREDLIFLLDNIVVEAVATVILLDGKGVKCLLGRKHEGGAYSRERQGIGDLHGEVGSEGDEKGRVKKSLNGGGFST